MRNLLVLALAGFFLLFAPSPAAAAPDEAEAVRAMLKERTDAALQVLEKEDLSEAEKQKRIMDLVEPVIDFELMAKLTLGKTNWTRLSENERQDFIGLFVERLKASYLDKTSLYSGQKIAYQQARMAGGKIQVPMELITSDKTVSVLYKFYSKGSEWKVYDVEINGVSLIKSYRSQFNEILRTGTVEDLFDELKTPVQE